MAILSVNNITKTFKDDIILDGITFSVNRGDKVAIIGDNGQGKTTLFRILTKQLEADKGFYQIDAEYGYLSQEVISDVNHTLLEEMEMAFDDLKLIYTRMENLVEKMHEDNNAKYIEEYSKLEELYRSKGGYDYKYQIEQMLAKFGFDKSYYNRSLKTFSGGERTRASFVRLLLNKPAILFLDEPTNHLDLVMIEWLEKYLKTYPGTVLIVSHDSVFIDNFANKVIEIENHKATMYSGNYTFYVNQKQMLYEQALKKYALQEKEIKRYEMLIKKFKPKPTKTAFAKSLETKLSKMERIYKPNNKKKVIKASFDATLETKVKMHIIEDLTFGYDNVPLTKPLNLIIKNQDKICFMGQNGCGKTTLLQCIMTNQHKISGFNADVRENLKYFYFDQTQQLLNPNITVFDTIHDEFPLMDNTAVRTLLGRFLFSDDEVFKEVYKLSGGEKIRLIFALISLRNYDILYLDEPTNHLDYSTKKVIAEILDDYPGTIIMVSHDRYFVNEVANKIIYIQNKDFIIEEGNYNDFIARHDIINDEFNYEVKSSTPKKEKIEKEVKQQSKKEKEQLEKKINILLEKLDELNAKINDENNNLDWVAYRDLAHEIKVTEEEVELLMNQQEDNK